MRKIISLCLALVMVFCMTVSAFAEEVEKVEVTRVNGDYQVSSKIKVGKLVSSLTKLTKDRMLFDNWYSDEGLTEIVPMDTVIEEPMTLYAGFVPDPEFYFNMYIGEKTADVFGKKLENDVAPIIRNGRTMLPARFVAENFGATVDWSDTEGLVTIVSRDKNKTIKITIGETEAFVNEEAVTLDSPAFVENDRTYTPVRFIAENLGSDVSWDSEKQEVIMTRLFENTELFERRTPESQGVDSDSIIEFLDRIAEVEGQENHHFMVVKNGYVVAEGSRAPYENGGKHLLYSCSKAYTSTAIGMLVDDGKLKLSDKIVDFFPEYQGMFGEGMENVTIENCLTMATGQGTGGTVHVSSLVEDDEKLGKILATPSENPGTEFRYDGNASYMLSRVISKVTGMGLDEFLDARLFSKYGIQKPYFSKDEYGYCLGSSGVKASCEELAALGQTYLDGGVWKGERLFSEKWAKNATANHISTEKVTTGEDWNQGYCFHFWRGKHDTFRFCGSKGQMCVCMPDKNAMFLVQSAFDNTKLYHILDIFYDTIYKTLSDEPLPEKDLTKFNDYVSKLALPKGCLPKSDYELEQ